MAGSNWTDAELDAIVADYFAMLNDEIRGVSYSKAEHRRELMKCVDRSNGSIEFKHCNITAVLEELGVSGIAGYKRRDNYQGAILNAIERYLDLTGARDLTLVPEGPAKGLLIVEAPRPSFRNAPLRPGMEQSVISEIGSWVWQGRRWFSTMSVAGLLIAAAAIWRSGSVMSRWRSVTGWVLISNPSLWKEDASRSR